jgi:hypothetical protein
MVQAPDGLMYGRDTSEEIDDLLEGCFTWGGGPKALAYLESITTRRVLGPDATDQYLRHLEGARWLVGVIRARMENHRKKKAASNERPSDGPEPGRRGKRRVGQ